MVTLPEDRLRFWYGQTPTSAPPQPRCGCLFATVLPFFAPIPPSDATIQNNLRSDERIFTITSAAGRDSTNSPVLEFTILGKFGGKFAVSLKPS